MEDLARLKCSRRAYKSHVSRLYRKIDEIKSSADVDEVQISSLSTYIEQLKAKREQLSDLDSKITPQITNEEELEEAILETESFIDDMLIHIHHAEKFIESQSTPSPPSSLRSTTERPPDGDTSSATVRFPPPLRPTDGSTTPPPFPHVSRLPKLTLPHFSGDPSPGKPFGTLDAAINQNTALSGVQKFSYLRAQLQGDAARTIAGLPLTEANYFHSVALLLERYGKTHKLKDAHMRGLLNIPSPTTKLSSLREFYDMVESHIRSLASLGQTSDSYGTLLVSIILQKLPSDIIRNLARENTSMEWSLEALRQAVLKEITIMEATPQIDSTSTESLNVTASFHTSTGKKSPTERPVFCVYCKGAHKPAKCESVTDQQKRYDIIKNEGRCFNCLGRHKVSNCTSKFRCRQCKQKHHTTLCKPKENTDGKDAAKSTVHATLSSSQSKAITSPTCLLKTAIAPLQANDIQLNGNILFDEGSQRSFISREMATKLRLQPATSETLSVTSFGTRSTLNQTLDVTVVNVVTASGETLPVSALIVPVIAAPLQNLFKSSIDSLNHIRGLKLAHPVSDREDFHISLLIGTDHYWTFVQDHIVRGDGPTAQQSKLGYLLSGPLPQPNPNFTTTLLSFTTSADQQDGDLHKFWELESTGTIENIKTEPTFLKSYQDNCVFQGPDGSYTASFPWKKTHPELPTNFPVCQNRTKTMIRRLVQSPELLRTYDDILSDQEKRGFIEKVPNASPVKGSHYLPHRPIKKESSTTPIRIVYDCSCSGSKKQPSLNDCLMVGPPFLNDLCSILLRFRSYTFALSADIEKAFLHVKLNEVDKDYTRFLWLSDANNPGSALTTYRFKVVPFGTASSPFMLYAAIDLHLSKFKSPVAKDVKRSLYVDNVLSGRDSEKEIIEYYQQARTILKQANFNLRSWSSNSQQLQLRTSEDRTNDTNFTVNVLGLRWNTLTDTLLFASKLIAPRNPLLVTKREVLQASSLIYDPLGFLTPVTVQAKILLQEIWQRLGRATGQRPQQQIAEWIRVLSGPPGECQETVD